MLLADFNPIRICSGVLRHRYLIGQLTRRDVLLKYRGSYLGIAWSFLYPLLLLSAFTFAFSGMIDSHWSKPADQPLSFALVMYCGLVVFNIFAEIATSAPRLILGYQSYVKKIIFPVEILPIVTVLTAFIHAAINLLFLVLAAVLVGHVHASALLAPLVVLPMLVLAFGIAWFLAATGVFVRDLVHVMPVFVQVAMFLSPVFYSSNAVPRRFQWLYQSNPLSVAIENLRRVMLWGESPDWKAWTITLVLSVVVTVFAYAFFVHGKEEFADVI